MLRSQGKFSEAKQAYQKALRIDPQYSKAHYNLGVLAELYLQDLSLALTHFQLYQSLQREPERMVGNWIKDLNRRVEALMPSIPEESIAQVQDIETNVANADQQQLNTTVSVQEE